MAANSLRMMFKQKWYYQTMDMRPRETRAIIRKQLDDRSWFLVTSLPHTNPKQKITWTRTQTSHPTTDTNNTGTAQWNNKKMINK